MSTPANDVARSLIALRYPPDAVAGMARDIYQAVLHDSPHVRQGNFTSIASHDLALLFDLYDARFFAGRVRQLLDAAGAPLSFHLSPRLTRSAGVTKRFVARRLPPGVAAPATRYELSLSSTLLFQTFHDVERTIRVNGLVCKDRLEAAQRVFEHELLHLIEMLVWGRSSCAAANFKALAWNFFTHTETRHDLVTPGEHARARFDVRVGDRARFDLDGQTYVGVVNRITRRATVLVESPGGARYSDGKHYRKYYVPLPLLRKLDGGPPAEATG
jgi:hypothetical protein